MNPWLRIATCLALSFAASAAIAQSCPSVPAISDAQLRKFEAEARDRGFLWRIEKAGHTSYLYGTLHVARPAWGYPGPRVTAALKAADVWAFEMDLHDPEIQRRMAAGLAMLPRNPLPDDTTERLRRQLRLACIPDSSLGSVPPEALANRLIVVAARRYGLYAESGIDMLLEALAHGVNKRTVSLEGPELQFGLLYGRSPEETVEMVEDALADVEDPTRQGVLRRLAEDWAAGELDDLSKYEEWCDCADTPFHRKLMSRLLDERNPALAQKIDALHVSGERVFAAVGSLHMIGPTGLPALMAKRGYRVERIAFGSP